MDNTKEKEMIVEFVTSKEFYEQTFISKDEGTVDAFLNLMMNTVDDALADKNRIIKDGSLVKVKIILQTIPLEEYKD